MSENTSGKGIHHRVPRAIVAFLSFLILGSTGFSIIQSYHEINETDDINTTAANMISTALYNPNSLVPYASATTANSCENLSIANSGVKASGDDGNIATNTIDNNFGTRWSNYGMSSWIRYDLSQQKTICSVQIAWYKGDTRINNFIISISNDDTNYATVYSGKSSGKTTGFETYILSQPGNGRYVKIVVNGNNLNNWASITEADIFGYTPTTNTSPTGGGVDDGTSMPTALRTIKTTSISSLMTAIKAAQPGDRIVLADGTYDTTDWLKSKSAKTLLVSSIKGTADNPIVITSETIGGAEVKGPAGFEFDNVSYLIIRGFKFTHSQDNASYSDDIAIRCKNCTHVRFTRNHFQLTTGTGNQADWLAITSKYSKYDRIDHNTFLYKKNLGVFVLLLGSDGVMTQSNNIDHNYFARYDTYISNGGECLRVGNSALGPSSAYTTIEYNLFEECNGDREAVTIKSSNNVIRYNTFRNNEGSLVLRHGNTDTVEGNFFIDNVGGVRVYGHDHKIINNYFEANTGGTVRQTLVMGTGTVESDLSTSNSEHSQARNILVAYNTLVDNTSHLVIGYGSGSYPPKDITIGYNIIKGNSGTLVTYTAGSNIVWKGNILYGSASKGGIPSSGYTFVDPLLAMQPDGVYRLKSSSPAIDVAGTSYSASGVTRDMDGQSRLTNYDCGADEYSSQAPTNKPLIKFDVGQGGTA